MKPLHSRDRNIDGRYVSAGMVEDDYSADSWPDWLPEHGPRVPKFQPRRGGEDGPVIVYRAGEEPPER